jgi:hypothetical protein
MKNAYVNDRRTHALCVAQSPRGLKQSLTRPMFTISGIMTEITCRSRKRYLRPRETNASDEICSDRAKSGGRNDIPRERRTCLRVENGFSDLTEVDLAHEGRKQHPRGWSHLGH